MSERVGWGRISFRSIRSEQVKATVPLVWTLTYMGGPILRRSCLFVIFDRSSRETLSLLWLSCSIFDQIVFDRRLFFFKYNGYYSHFFGGLGQIACCNRRLAMQKWLGASYGIQLESQRLGWSASLVIVRLDRTFGAGGRIQGACSWLMQ